MKILNFADTVLRLGPKSLYELDRRESVRERSQTPIDAVWGFDIVRYAKDRRTEMNLRAVVDLSTGTWPSIKGTDIPWRQDDVSTALHDTAKAWSAQGEPSKHFRRIPPEVVLGYYEIWREACCNMTRCEP